MGLADFSGFEIDQEKSQAPRIGRNMFDALTGFKGMTDIDDE